MKSSLPSRQGSWHRFCFGGQSGFPALSLQSARSFSGINEDTAEVRLLPLPRLPFGFQSLENIRYDMMSLLWVVFCPARSGAWTFSEFSSASATFRARCFIFRVTMWAIEISLSRVHAFASGLSRSSSELETLFRVFRRRRYPVLRASRRASSPTAMHATAATAIISVLRPLVGRISARGTDSGYVVPSLHRNEIPAIEMLSGSTEPRT
mmetsp:Transcript_28205/g.66981  ORF Transcript_28205/g.66981 Transcript_28205/m.66981 type:complete len:209 (+) Transcript_28205:160-786(+)